MLKIILKYFFYCGVFMVLFFSAAAFTTACVQDGSVQEVKNATKILFIGNSITYFNDMPGMLRKMAQETGKNVFVAQAVMGGAKVSDHCKSSRTRKKIAAKKWDYVIIQQAQAYVAFPKDHKYILPHIRELKDRIFENCGKTKIVFFMDMSLLKGIHWYGKYYSYSESQDMLSRGTLKIAKKMDFLVAPVGRAWAEIVKDHPEINLYHPDGVHPSYTGSYLQACVYFATIFRESAAGNRFIGKLDEKTAALLQSAASKTVLDNPERWRLR